MGVWKRYTSGGWVAQDGVAVGTTTAAELAHWQAKAALLDPAAYEYVTGTGWTRTVPAGKCWHALNLWYVRTSDGAGYQFLRTLDANRAVPLPAGTTLTADASQLGFAYLCKPELVTASDSRYTADPKGLYYERLDRLHTLAQSDLSVTVAAAAAQGTTAQTNFPTDFDEGVLSLVSQHDISWLTLGNASGGVNTLLEISDDHEQRVAEAVLVPFTRATFPYIKIRNASVLGQASGFSGLAGYGAVRYTKLPSDW